MSVDDFSDDCEWRLAAYKELVSVANELFRLFLFDYCSNCQAVIRRLPEAEEEVFTLVEGVYPGCCHRGAGDIFRLEGQTSARSHLAQEIIEGLQRERQQLLHRVAAGNCGGTYTLRRQRDNYETIGAHCQYFSAYGCTLGALKGPLCINFICPPLRRDLLCVCDNSEALVGPESDFLLLYQTLAVISYDARDKVEQELKLLRYRVADCKSRCRRFLASHKIDSLYDFFNGDK